jgi:hypothetical protein
VQIAGLWSVRSLWREVSRQRGEVLVQVVPLFRLHYYIQVTCGLGAAHDFLIQLLWERPGTNELQYL